MTERMTMKTKDLTQERILLLKNLFPNCITETKVDGETVLAVNFDVLKQELSNDLIDDFQERYQFTWPEKSQAKLLASTPTTMTLRPCVDESVDFDGTKNIYIKGDNLEVLKILHETYLNKIKLIYIDPPYNTGNDFVYNDDFRMNSSEFSEINGEIDDEGNRLVLNSQSNGRFHTDWLNMIYPRLKIAKDLLSDDGAIFISIDDNELDNLIKCCNEIFGKNNFICNLIWKSKSGGANDSKFFAIDHEYVIVYAKNSLKFKLNLDKEATVTTSYNRKDEFGEYSLDRLDKQSIRYSKSLDYEIVGPDGQSYWPQHKNPEKPNATWRWSKENVEANYDKLVFEKGHIYTKNYKKEGSIPRSLLLEDRFGRTRTGKTEFYDMMGENYFSNPKPSKLIRYFEMIASDPNSIILDFFSGSGTTAQATMQLNSEDGGKRRFILVQLPEELDSKTDAYRDGYSTICDVALERIKRASKKYSDTSLDTGFRVFELDSSNLNDIYYAPDEIKRSSLDDFADNLKPDRTGEDLLIQVMLELGIELSASIVKSKINQFSVFNVDDGYLIACFDESVTEDLLTTIAKSSNKPVHVVFRDRAFQNDSILSNLEQIFKTYSSQTNIHII